MSELKKCPRCGELGALFQVQNVVGWHIGCSAADCTLEFAESFDRPEDAIAVWNERAPVTVSREDVERATKWTLGSGRRMYRCDFITALAALNIKVET